MHSIIVSYILLLFRGIIMFDGLVAWYPSPSQLLLFLVHLNDSAPVAIRSFSVRLYGIVFHHRFVVITNSFPGLAKWRTITAP